MFFDPREPASEVWCCCWERCGGLFVPGFVGGGQPVLCAACERDRLAAEGRARAIEGLLRVVCEAEGRDFDAARAAALEMGRMRGFEELSPAEAADWLKSLNRRVCELARAGERRE